MCPLCLGTMAAIVAGATSTSGIAALLAMKVKGESTKMNETSIVSLAPSRIESGPVLLIAGLQEHYRRETMRDIPAQWQRFVPHIGQITGQVGSKTYGLVFNTQNGTDGFEYLCGVEVSGFSTLPDEFVRVSIPSLRYAVFPHTEHVSKISDTIGAIWRDWFPTSGYKTAQGASDVPSLLEVYGDGFDPRRGMGDIEIWIPVQEAKQ